MPERQSGYFPGAAPARFSLTGYVSGLLFAVTETDRLTFASVALGLTSVALIATAVPALRASRIDPMLSLKGERGAVLRTTTGWLLAVSQHLLVCGAPPPPSASARFARADV
jgi:hypothetical protein